MSLIDMMQRELEKAQQRTAMLSDGDTAGRIRDQGTKLVFLVNGLIRTCRLHDVDNAAFRAPSKELCERLTELLDLLGAVHLVCVEDQIYINDVRLRVRDSEQEMLAGLEQELGRHNVGGISFYSPLTAQATRMLAKIISAASAPQSPRQVLQRRLAVLGDIELTGKMRFQIGRPAAPEERGYDATMRRGMAVIKAVAQRAEGAKMVNPVPVRRVVIDLIESIKVSPVQAAAEPLRSRQISDEHHHMLSVCSLSLLLGEAIQLDESVLSDLGVTAMMHDMGTVQGDLESQDHVVRGTRTFLRQRGFHEAKLRRLLAILEHHEPYCREGEAASNQQRPSLFARIIRIVDDYDHLVAARGRKRCPLSPAAAMRTMWPHRGHQYDPTLLVLFAQLMGLYPPGSIIELNDGRWAMSISGGRGSTRFALPLVQIVRDACGRPLDFPEPLDLFDGKESVRPVRVVPPPHKGIDTSRLLGRLFS